MSLENNQDNSTPGNALLTQVSAYYENEHLFVTFDAVELAATYTISVKDDTGTEVLRKTIPNTDFVPPVQLNGADFTPELGKQYAISVVVSGPESNPASITPFSISKPELTVEVKRQGASFSWDLLAFATKYELLIATTDAPQTSVYRNNLIETTPVLVEESNSLTVGVPYIARLRGTAGFSYGLWSNDIPFQLSSAKQILFALKERLEIHKPTPTTVSFNEMTLPDGEGNPSEILKLIKTHLGVDELLITYAYLPAISADESSLTLKGTADWKGVKIELEADFKVSPLLDLQLTMTMTLPLGWKFSDSFSGLDFSDLNYLYLSESQIVFTSFEHEAEDRFIPLITGMNFFSSYSYTSDFSRVTPGSVVLKNIIVGGSIVRKGEGVEIHLSGKEAISDITINLTGLPALTFTGGILSIISTPVAGTFNLDKALFDGYITQFGADIRYQINAPTFLKSALKVKLKEAPADYNLPAVLEATSGNALNGLLPASLMQLAQLSIADLEYVSSMANNTTKVSLVLRQAESASYTLIPSIITLSKVEFSLATIHSMVGKDLNSIFSANLSGRFTFGGLPVDVAVFVPLNQDWELSLRPLNEGTATLANVGDFTGESESSILSVAPTFFQQLSGFSVKEIKVGAAIVPPDGNAAGQFSPHLSFVSFHLAQDTPWNIINGVLTLSNWTLKTLLTKVEGNWSTSGTLSGKIKLGNGSNAVTFATEMAVPIGEAGWRIGLAEEGFNLPGIGDILRVIGADGVASFLPKGIQSFGSARISVFEVYFNPTESPVVKKVGFQMSTSEPWTVIGNRGLEIKNIEAGVTLRNGIAATDKYALGFIRGTLTIAGVDLVLNAGRAHKDDPWIFETTTIDTIHLPGLTDLTAWMLPDTVVQYIPTKLMPFAEGLDIINAGFQFDLSTNTLNYVSFSIANRERWNLIEGFVSLDNALLKAKIDHPFEAHPGLTLQAEALLSIASLAILIKAEKAAPNADWIFSGELANPVSFNFDEALQALSMNLSLAYNLGFPRELILEKANAMTNATKGSFAISARSLFDWHIGFGRAALSVQSLGFDLKIDAVTEIDKDRTYSCNVNGRLLIGNLQVDVHYLTGNKLTDKTILIAAATRQSLENASIDSFVDTLTTTDTKGEKWAATIPAGYATPIFKEAYLHLNLTDNSGFLFGSVSNLGNAAVMIKKIAEDNWGYAFGLALGEGFTFGSIFSPLGIIDSILTIKNAGLFVVSYEGSTQSVMKDLAEITNFPDKPESFTSAVTIPDMGDIQLSKGMLCYGHLSIDTSPLFSKLLEIGTNGVANVVVSAAIDKTDSTKSTFIADLPDITVLSTLVFTHTVDYSGIHLRYLPGKLNEFSLVTRLKIDAIFGKNYAFDGSLLVNDDKLDATLSLVTGSTNNDIVHPFGLRGLIIRSLRAAVGYTFKKAAVPAHGDLPAVPATHTKSRFSIKGAVKIGRPPADGTADNRLDLDIELNLAEANPVLARLKLNEDLSVGAFFAQFLTGDGTNWPSKFIEITFKSGSEIYYYDKAKDTHGLFLKGDEHTYVEGFNIDASINLHILVDIPIHFNLHANKNTDGKFNGVIASGSILKRPIDLYVLQIAGTTLNNGKYIGPPVFLLDTTTEPGATMGFAAGFNFFQKPFGTVDLKLRKTEDKNELQLIGKLESAVKFEPFGELKLDFTYSKSAGFRITNWPTFDFLQEAIDFVQKLKDIANEGSGPCGKLAGFVMEQAYKTKFTITPSFDTKSDGLYFVLNGAYSLSVFGNEFLSAKFPKALEFFLPTSLSMDELPGQIFKSLAGAARSFVKAMLDNPDAIAKFLVIVAGKKATQYAADLLCEGLIDVAVPTAVGAGTTALAEAGGLAAGSAAIAAAATVIAAAVKDAGGGGDHGGDKNPKPPAFVELSYQDGTITVTWQASSFASGYDVVFYNEHNQQLKKETISYNRSATLTLTPEMNGDRFIVKIASLRGSEYTSAYAEKTISRWQIPANVVFAALNDTRQLKASWIGDAQKYEIQLKREGIEVSTLIAEAGFATIDSATLKPGNYSVTVLAKGNDKSRIPSLPSQNSASVTILENPAGVSISYLAESNELLLTAGAVAGASGFEVKVLDAAGILLIEQNLTTPAGEPLSRKIGLNDLVVNVGIYHALVTAKGDARHLVSIPVSSVNMVTKSADVEAVTMIADNDHSSIVVGWDYLDDTETYEIQLFKDGGETPLISGFVNQPEIKGRISYTIAIKPFVIATGGSFMAKVRVKGTANKITGNLVASSTSVSQYPMPTNVLANWSKEDQKVVLNWTNTVGAVSFAIEMSDTDSKEVIFRKTVSGTTAQIGMSELSSLLNGNYQIGLCALGDDAVLNSGVALSNLLQIINLPLPNLSVLILEGNLITTSIQGLAKMADGYEAQLMVGDLASGEIQKMTPSSDEIPVYSFTFNIDDALSGNKFEVQVRTTRDGALPSAWIKSADAITRLQSAALSPLLINNDLLLVKLTSTIENATKYEAILLVDGVPLGAGVELVPDGRDLIPKGTFKLSNDLIGKNLNVKVQASAAHYIRSMWTTSIDSVTYHPAVIPKAPELSIAESNLKATWNEQTAAGLGYELEISDGKTGNALKPQPAVMFSQNSGLIALSSLGFNTAYKVRIRQVKTGQRQVLKNGDAAEGLKHWDIIKDGGDKWRVENGPGESCKASEGNTNFVTSFDWDAKSQTIDLLSLGFTAEQLDRSPEIKVSDWTCSRFDCKSFYELTVRLLDKDKKLIGEFKSGVIDAPIGGVGQHPWTEVAHIFKDYGGGIRFIYFEHSGKDKNRWKGHYGSKMTGARVYITLKEEVFSGPWSAFSNTVVTPPDPTIPCVVVVPYSTPIEIPSELKKTISINPDLAKDSSEYPVIKWNGLTYWALSFMDNRYAMAIVVYDLKGNMVKRLDYNGARYIYDIKIGAPGTDVVLIGQANNKILIPWERLFNK